jgi:hypothetical protein
MPKSLLKPLFNGALVLIYYFKKHFKPYFFILKTFCSTLKFVNWRIRILMSRTDNCYENFSLKQKSNEHCTGTRDFLNETRSFLGKSTMGK